MKMKMLFLKQDTTNRLKKHFSPETLRKIRQVKLDYLRLFKYTMVISGTSLLIFLIHRQIPYFNHYYLYFVENEKNKKIIDSILPIDYRVTPYLPSCLMQMIFNEVKSKPDIQYKREYIKTHDDGVLSLDWVKSDERIQKIKNPDKLLVVLHGLTGGSETSYIREIIEEFKNYPGFEIVAINYRGIAESPLLTPLIYHAGYTEDLYTAMKYIKKKNPNLRCYAIGTSMGANIFTKLLSNHHEFDDYIKGFISVSNPLNCLEVEKRTRGGVLDMFIIRRQVRYIEKHKEILKEKIGKIFMSFTV
jgi:predicted alpha/beta-fold hydrolase